jgi:hypothetical protein
MDVVTAATCRAGELRKMITSIPEQAITPPVAPVKKTIIPRSKTKPGQAKRAKQNVKRVAAARRGSKTAKVLALLKRPTGASLHELIKATGWQPHSVRGFLSGTLKKKMGLKLESSRREDQDRVYRLRSK